MAALTLLNLDIGSFTGEGQVLLINKFLYSGLKQTAILGRVSYVPDMELTRDLRIILRAIWINIMQYSLRHNESFLDKVRQQLSVCHRDLITLRTLLVVTSGLPLPLMVMWHSLLTL